MGFLFVYFSLIFYNKIDVYKEIKMLIAVIIFILLVFYFFLIYNKFVRLKNMAEEAWSGIEVQLKRRCNLVPNLVDTVKAYAKHEKSLFENITESRKRAMNSYQIHERSIEEKILSNSMLKIFAVVENYPDLKASENFLKLQEELVDIEDQIQYARRYFNGTVRNNNIFVQSFPSLIVASTFKFKEMEFFDLESIKEEIVPKVNID